MDKLWIWALGSAAVLALYVRVIVYPQVRELRRKAAIPEYRGTAHLARLQFCLGNMTRLQARASAAAAALAALGLVLAAAGV